MSKTKTWEDRQAQAQKLREEVEPKLVLDGDAILVDERETFKDITEPYGWIAVEEAQLWARKVTRNWNGTKSEAIEYTVTGTVTGSSWCGALCCGVPVSKPREKYPKGSHQSFYWIKVEEWVEGQARHVAM